MSQTLREFQDAFRVAELTVYGNASWTWSVRPRQPTLGASIVSLNRFAERVSDITGKEATDLRDMFVTLETAQRRAFGYEKINYLMLMMVDAHVHYHVLPRYAETKRFGERSFPDGGWPKLPDLGADHADGDEAVLAGIVAALRDAL
jgi:diadenosine tetraphosphate (Ap4A) HIT family hydrolase